jgi:nucleotide-binding universal stress UspA family protein
MHYFENSKILAPYDFSVFSQAAVDTAMRIAGNNEHVTVLHVVDPVSISYYPTGVGLDPSLAMNPGMTDLEEAAEIDDDHQASALKRMKAEFGDSQHQGLHFDTMVEEAADGISAYAELHDFDLIVLPSHGHTGLKRLLIGSTAERVVRLAHCPVLVVRS